MVQKTKLRDTKQLAVNKAIDSVQSGKFSKALNIIKKHFGNEASTTYFFRGWIAQLSGEHVKAIKLFEKSLIKSPINIDVLTGLAASYLEIGEYDKAQECAEQCLLLNKEDPKNLVTLATIVSKRYKQDTEKQKEAIQYYSQAFSLVKNRVTLTKEYVQLATDILSGWGASLINIHEPERALLLLEAAVDLDPLNPLVHKNLASVYTSLNMIEQAVDSAKKAQRSDDTELVYDAMYQEGMLELMRGNYARGWRLHETRLKTKQFAAIRNLKTPQWAGQTLLKEESILVYQEQGIGDTLQFSRYLPMLAERAKNIDIEVMANQYQKWDNPSEEPGSIRQFLHNNYQEYVRNSYVKGWNSPNYEDYTYIVSFMSLPRLFKTTLDTVPAIPRFSASNSSESTVLYDVGIFWQGSSQHKNDYNRSMPICWVQKLLNLYPQTSFVSLQLECFDELKRYDNITQPGPTIHGIDDTLAIINSCRQIITVDSMIAHLSGSAGKQTKVLHAFSPDWRWMLDTHNCPWYPSITNIRQKDLGNWNSVIKQLQEHLE